MANSNNPPNGAMDIGSRLELFIDEGLIDRLHVAQRRLHHPVPQEVSMVPALGGQLDQWNVPS